MDNNVKKQFPKTYDAILEAFAGESEARNKYDFFAKIARKEGHPKLDDFFRETAMNENQHAKLLYKLVGGLGDTKENLKECIESEEYEHESMYPNFAKIAKEEGFKEVEAKLCFVFCRFYSLRNVFYDRSYVAATAGVYDHQCCLLFYCCFYLL